MATEHQALRNLLAGELPLDAVGPHLRQTARRALRADDTERMVLVARAIVGELLRRGDLLRVAVEQPVGSPAAGRHLCLLKGTNRVVDLSVLKSDTLALDETVGFGEAAPAPVVARDAHGLTSVTGMLGAMEDAQDLDIGDLHSGETAVVLAGILRLLGKFTPQFRLFVMLSDQESLGGLGEQVFQRPLSLANENWLNLRGAGQSVWIPVPAELPAPILAQVSNSDASGFAATAAVAVPLWKPPLGSRQETPRHEAGLFFVVARDEWGRETLLRLADRLTRFVTRRWQHQWEVNQRIHTDSLTGAFNRAYFDKQFTLELERARRSDVPLTLIAADLDHFKAVNDTYGHQAGDKVLQMVVRRLQEELRRIDHVCRIGGEEFALVLPDTGQEAAQEVAVRLLDAPFTEEIMHKRQLVQLEISFSYGAVTFPGAGSDAFELYRKADAMQYLSKDRGRNRCHFWNSRGDHIQLLPSKQTERPAS